MSNQLNYKKMCSTKKRIKERNELLKQMVIHKSYQAEASDLLETANDYMKIAYGEDWDK